MKFTLAFLKSTGITRPPVEDLGGIHIINIDSLTRDLYGYQGDERTYTTFQTSDLIVMNGSQNDLIIEPSTYSIQFDTEKMLETSVNVSADIAQETFIISSNVYPVAERTVAYNGDEITVNAYTDEQININIQDYINQIEINKDINDTEFNGFAEGTLTYNNGLPNEVTLNNNIIQR
jgi:hypothetical protein